MDPTAGDYPPSTDFPTDPAKFENDERISFSKPHDAFILETAGGTEFVFNMALKRWVETVCLRSQNPSTRIHPTHLCLCPLKLKALTNLLKRSTKI